MRRIVILIGVMLLWPLAGQGAPHMLFPSDGDVHGYLGPVVKSSTMQSSPGYWTGLRAGWASGDGITLDAEIDWLMSGVFGPGMEDIDIAYGGIGFGVLLWSVRTVDIRVRTLLGAGQAGDVGWGMHSGIHGDQEREIGSDRFFITEPGIHLSVELKPELRLSGGVNYLLVNGIGMADITDSRVSGPHLDLMMEFHFH